MKLAAAAAERFGRIVAGSNNSRNGPMAEIQAAPSPKEGLEDLLWTLLNTREFEFNH